jgi:MFS family permease
MLKRHVMVLMIFSGLSIAYILRTSMSVAAEKPSVGSITKTMYTEFGWTDKEQGFALASFFVGYALTQIPGSYCAKAYGCTNTFGLGVLGASVFTTLTPLASNYSMLCILRILTGMAEGVTFPVMAMIWTNWAPPKERSTLMSISIAGCYFGTCLALPVSAWLVESYSWELIFYASGACGMVWAVVWFLVVADTPASHKTITQAELLYITQELEEEDGGSTRSKGVHVSWGRIFRSRGVLVLLTGGFAYTWGFYLLLTELPSYLSSCLGFSVHKSGLLSIAPFFSVFVSTMGSGFVADYLLETGTLSRTHVRKLMQVTGMVVPGACLLLAGFSDSTDIAVACFILSAFFSGCCCAGFAPTCLEVAGDAAGSVYGLVNTVATIPGFAVPILAGSLTQNFGDKPGFRILFLISFVVEFVAAIVWILFATTERDTRLVRRADDRDAPFDKLLGCCDCDGPDYQKLKPEPGTTNGKPC